MSTAITEDGQISINGYKYHLASPLTERLMSRLPAKVNIGADSYDKENYLSNWIIKDQRGGIGIDEMDESVHADRCWWTNCIIEYSGHMTLPRLATAVTGVGDGWALPESAAGDASTAVVWANDANSIDGSISTAMTTGSTATNNIWTENEVFGITSANIDSIRYFTTVDISKWDILIVDVYYTAGWHEIYNGVPTANVWTTVTIGSTEAVTQGRIRLQHNGTTTDACTFSEFQFGMATAVADYSSETSFIFENFNGDLYLAAGEKLLCMDSSRNFYLVRTFPTNITALKSSLNSCLYVFLGAPANYYYMTTAGLFNQSNAAGNYAIQWGDLLWKMTTAGIFTSSADPNSATPTWANEGDITDIASQIESLFVGRDADGNSVIYCATNSILKNYDDTNTKWLDTELRLPTHPNGGKGAVYWNDAYYISYGLGVKKYIPGGSISDIGLDRDGGLPYEYNGEIVKFCQDSMNYLFALVDASQVTGTSKSGLYAFNGLGWYCWWAGSNDDEVLYDVIVSPAESQYAVYWVCEGSIYYIDMFRGISNPRKMMSNTLYESYTSGKDASIYGTTYYAQTFTPSTGHTIKLVRLCLYHSGNVGTVTISIRATDGSGHPTGSNLCSSVADSNSISTDPNGGWNDFSMGGGTALTGSTKYSIVITKTGTGNLNIFVDSTSASYAGGNIESSSNGSTWSVISGYDALFEEYGETTSFPYAATGIYLSPSFDAGSQSFEKLAINLNTWSKGITTTETVTIKYRFDKQLNDIDSGWNTLETLDTIAENGLNEEIFGSGTGLKFQSFQFRLDFARGSTETFTPDIQALTLSYLLLTGGAANKAWNFTVNIDGQLDNTSERQQYNNLWSALTSDNLVPVIFRRNDTTETHYVQLYLQSGFVQTGDHYTGQMSLMCVEL